MFKENITAQIIFMYPAELLYEFMLSLFALRSLGYGLDLILTIIIAIVFWAWIARILAVIVRRVTGFEVVK